jgi:GntR family transcriptional regulator
LFPLNKLLHTTRVWDEIFFWEMGMPTFSRRPLYLQLCDLIRDRIATRVWMAGTALPNEGDLAREFGVSPGTVRKALERLEEMRLITRRQGRGSFVCDLTSGELVDRFATIRGADGENVAAKAGSVEIERVAATAEECARLRLAPGDPVYRIRRLLLAVDAPFMIEKASMPAALFPGLEQQEAVAGQVALLARHFGVLLGKGSERVATEPASREVSEALGLAEGAIVVVLDRVILGLDGRPIEWRTGWCNLASRHYRAEIA